MIKILNEIFNQTLKNYNTKNIGNKVYINLDSNRRIELSFYNTFSADRYDSIKLVLFHKENGQLHCQVVKFENIFSCIQDMTHPNKIGKHIWHNECYEWYGRPTTQDIKALNEVLVNYIETWI